VSDSADAVFDLLYLFSARKCVMICFSYFAAIPETVDFSELIPVVPVNKMVHRQGYVFPPAAKGCEMEVHNIYSIVEFFSKTAALDELFECPILDTFLYTGSRLS
jgi:hypothetical protein